MSFDLKKLIKGDSFREKDSPKKSSKKQTTSTNCFTLSKDVSLIKNGDTGQKYFARCQIIKGQLIDLLLDTGSQVSAIPKKFVPKQYKSKIRQAYYNLISYSGNSINVHGLIELDVHIGEIYLENVTFFIVDSNQPILGTPAIIDNKLEIDLYNRRLIQRRFLQEEKKNSTIRNARRIFKFFITLSCF